MLVSVLALVRSVGRRRTVAPLITTRTRLAGTLITYRATHNAGATGRAPADPGPGNSPLRRANRAARAANGTARCLSLTRRRARGSDHSTLARLLSRGTRARAAPTSDNRATRHPGPVGSRDGSCDRLPTDNAIGHAPSTCAPRIRSTHACDGTAWNTTGRLGRRSPGLRCPADHTTPRRTSCSAACLPRRGGTPHRPLGTISCTSGRGAAWRTASSSLRRSGSLSSGRATERRSAAGQSSRDRRCRTGANGRHWSRWNSTRTARRRRCNRSRFHGLLWRHRTDAVNLCTHVPI